MLGRVPDLYFGGQSAGLFWGERGVQRTFGVCIQVVAHQRDLVCSGKHPVELFAHRRKIRLFAMLHHHAFTQTRCWLADHHDFCHAAALVFTVLTPPPCQNELLHLPLLV